MIILALDLGKFNTMCCLYNSKTRKHECINAATERNYLTTLFKKTKCDLVVMEACGPSGWINVLPMSLGQETLVCSTNEDAWKWSNVKRKTDKDDALKLARMDGCCVACHHQGTVWPAGKLGTFQQFVETVRRLLFRLPLALPLDPYTASYVLRGK